MAQLYSGILGSLSGKVGNLVFYTYRGRSFVRGIPKPSDKAPTEKQLIHRARFCEVQRFIGPIARYLNQANPGLRKMSAANKATKEVMGSALTGSYPTFGIDYSKVQLLSGSLIFPHVSMQTISGLREIALRWEHFREYWTNSDDELLVMIYCPENSLWFKPDLPFRREDHGCFIKVPAVFHNKSIHVWAAFRSSNHRECSRTQYLGNTIIQNPLKHVIETN